MKKTGKRLLAALLLLVMCLPMMTGCDKKDVSGDGDATKLVIYYGGNKVVGANDAEVKAAIEEKFYQDTGNKIDLEVKVFQTSDLNTKVDLAIAGGEQIDGIISNVGSTTGLDRFVNENAFFTDLTPLIDEYGSALKEKVPQIAFDTVTSDGKIFAIPEIAYEGIYGILIRKDWLDDAGLPIPTTIEEFETALRAFRDRDSNIVPMVGYHWDMDRVILPGAYNCVQASYFYLDGNGNIMPGFLNPNYKTVLETEYNWIQEGLWDIDNASRTASSCDNLFISGRAGVYIQYPEIMAEIDIARKVKVADPDAELEVIGPLTGPDGYASFQKANACFGGVLVPATSENAALMVQYYNWLVSDPANYELAKYGREGYEWVDVGEGLRGLPEGAEDIIATSALYDGIFCTLDYTTVSDRLWDTYTEQELRWIDNVRHNYPLHGDAREGVFWPDQDSEMAKNYSTASDNFKNEILTPARNGLLNTSDKFDAAVESFKTANADYLAWMNEYYHEHKPE